VSATNFRLVVEAAVRVHAHEVIGENSLDHRGVPVGHRLRPLPLAFLEVAFRLRGAGVLCPDDLTD
jgi:hypothetical protein